MTGPLVTGPLVTGPLVTGPLGSASGMEGSTARLDVVRRLATEHGADAAILTHGPSIRWAVGFTGSNSLLVVTPEAAHLVTDGRYGAQARAEVRGARVHAPGYLLAEHVAEAGLLGSCECAVIQAEHVSVAEHGRIEAILPGLDLLPVAELLSAAVAAKDEATVERVRRAQALTCAVFEETLRLVRPGVTERELAAEIVYGHLKRGAERMAFEPIVASGPNAALPHARPTDRALQPGDFVVLDMGGVVDGVCADLTRTVAVGEPSAEMRKAYEAVREAKARALQACEAGQTGASLDRTARGVLERAGLAEHFTHSLGHGVGFEVHEWPRLSGQVEHVLPAGATVTVEPGVYLPGRFGLRIEDLVVVRERGYENLTPLGDGLIVL